MKQNEKVYYIPKNLNDDFTFLAHYNLGDLTIIIASFCAATIVAMNLHILWCYHVPILYTMLRFKIQGFPVYYWAKVAIGYLLSTSLRSNEYILFEKERNIYGNDKSPKL